MPLYEYCCPNGHRFEKVTTPEVVAYSCPLCQGLAPRVVAAPAPHRVYAENPASAANWRRHQEAAHDVMEIGRRQAVAHDVEHGALVPQVMAQAIRSSRRRFETPTGAGPKED